MSKREKKTLADEKPVTARESARRKRQRRRDEMDEKIAEYERMTPEERAAIYKKPPLARLWDRFLPGDYTISQDRKHMLAIFIVIAVILGLACTIWWFTLEKEKYSVSEELTIPASSYVSGTEQNVVDLLEGYGFKQIEVSDGNIIAHGSPEKVQAYLDSYYEKNVVEAESLLTKNLENYGVENMEISDDGKVLRIYTTERFDTNTYMMKIISGNSTVGKIVQAYSTWCRMKNANEPFTVELYYHDEETGVSEAEAYFSCSPCDKAEQLLAMLEKQEAAAAQPEEEGAQDASEED